MDNFSFMLSELKFTRWFFAAVCVFLAVQNLAYGESQEIRKVAATGAGLDGDAALKNAFKVAVEEAVGTLVDTETIVREDDTIQEKILSASNGFIKSYDLIRQWNEDGLIRCRIEALVEIRQLKERLAAANISTLAVSGTDLAARVQTETSATEGAAAILGKRINDFPNRVLRIQGGEPVPDVSKHQAGVTRLKIPIMISVDQAAYNQAVDELTAVLDKLALGKVTANLHLPRDDDKLRAYIGQMRAALCGTSGVRLLSTDKFYASANGPAGEQTAALNALSGLAREAQQKFSTLPEAPDVVSVTSGLSRTGGTRLSLYAVNKLALTSLDVAKSSKIKITVQLLDASGNELDSSELSLDPRDENGNAFGFILEKRLHSSYSALGIGDVLIWPGLRINAVPYSLQISTSWTGDVYVDVDTEKLPRLKRCKLSVSMPEFPNSTHAQTPTESVGVKRAELSVSDGNAESQSQLAVSPNTTPQSIEVRRAEIVGSQTPSASPTGQVPRDDSFAKAVVDWISTGNGSSLICYTADNHVNYFGNRGMSNDFIQQDIGRSAHVPHISQSLEMAHD